VAELTKEQFEQVPDFLRDDYEQVGDVYRHKAEGKSSALKTSLNSLNEKLSGVNGELESIRANQSAAIEKAKADALEQARTKGDVATIEKRYQEQMADLERRMGGELELVKAEKEMLLNQSKQSKREALLSEARAKLRVFDESAKIFDRVVGSMIDIDPLTGKETFLSDDGSATSLDRAGFYAQLEKDPAFARMRQAEVTSTGGIAQGNNSRGGGAGSGGSFGGSKSERLKAIKTKFNLPE